jgi:hypothetical protein
MEPTEIRTEALKMVLSFNAAVITAAVASGNTVKWNIASLLSDTDDIVHYIETGEKP